MCTAGCTVTELGDGAIVGMYVRASGTSADVRRGGRSSAAGCFSHPTSPGVSFGGAPCYEHRRVEKADIFLKKITPALLNGAETESSWAVIRR